MADENASPLALWVVGPPELVGPLLEWLAAYDARLSLDYGRVERLGAGQLLSLRWLLGPSSYDFPADAPAYRATQQAVDERVFQGERLLAADMRKAARAKRQAAVEQASFFKRLKE